MTTGILKFKKSTHPLTTDHHSCYPRDLTTKEAAAYLNVSKALLEKLRHLGGGPAYLKYGRRCVRYRQADLDAFRNQYRMEG